MSSNPQNRGAKQSHVDDRARIAIEEITNCLREELTKENGLAHILTALAIMDVNSIDAIRDWVNNGIEVGTESVGFGSIDIIALYRKDKKILNSRKLHLD